MGKDTTRERAVEACAEMLAPVLLATEDLDATEARARAEASSVFAEALGRCLERFDAGLRALPPVGWEAVSRPERTLTTTLGRVTYRRTRFRDALGRSRYLADELLGVAGRARLSGECSRWLARRAAFVSYREASAELAEMSGVRVSPRTVMGAVRLVGERLLRDRPAPEGPAVSVEAAYLEVDGVWAHVQASSHRRRALPRAAYEARRSSRSHELKFAVCYAGKHVEGSRVVRDRVDCMCSDSRPSDFWGEAASMVGSSFRASDLETLWVGTDGGSWCDPWPLELLLPAGCSVVRSLDPFHVLQKVVRAFPEGPGRDYVASLARAGKAARAVGVVERVLPQVRSESRRKRLRELASYLGRNAGAVRFPKPSLGTMEGTNAHVGSRRLKGRGRSWSLPGMLAMGAVCCAVYCGRELPAPDKRPFFTERELAARDAALPASASKVPMSEGRGWETPLACRTALLPARERYLALTP